MPGLRTFEGAVALVTGGASGIGAALGRELARRGGAVLLADRDRADAEAQAARICERGGRAEARGLDVRDAAAVEALVADVFERHAVLALSLALRLLQRACPWLVRALSRREYRKLRPPIGK